MIAAEIKIDATQFVTAAGVFERAGAGAPAAIQRALNRAGDMAKTQVTRALVPQTGLSRKVIVKALKTEIGAMSYAIKSKGGDVRVQFFGAKESGNGVVAHPWGQSRHYAGGFMKQGFAKRVPFTKPGMAGHVFKRDGSSRLPIGQLKSGLYIPKEMVSGASEAAFQATARDVLPRRLEHEIGRLLGGGKGGE